MTTHNDILIIGAGATGLMTAKELSSAGYKVTILEASGNAGGRMCTHVKNKFGIPVESGAEFIHGNKSLTLQLLQEANIGCKAITGKMLQVKNGKATKTEEPEANWDELIQRMDSLEEDMTIYDFLSRYFVGEQYAQLRESVQKFAEGFDLADITKAAVIPLKKEWMHEEETQYRINGGYIKLTDHLLETCLSRGVEIHCNCVASSINWEKNKVVVTTFRNKTFTASKLVITVSIGILQSGRLIFSPAVPEHVNAANAIGFGSVIKVLLQFKEPFWKKLSKKVGFILSNEPIPTWWTQLPDDNTLLTGWLGGPKAYTYRDNSSEEIIQLSIESLSSISNIMAETLRKDLLHSEVFNWSSNEYVLGGYSYNTLLSAQAKETLKTPVQDTLFFAGEALYTGDAQGTVEAALQSGVDTAGKIRKL